MFVPFVPSEVCLFHTGPSFIVCIVTYIDCMVFPSAVGVCAGPPNHIGFLRQFNCAFFIFPFPFVSCVLYKSEIDVKAIGKTGKIVLFHSVLPVHGHDLGNGVYDVGAATIPMS